MNKHARWIARTVLVKPKNPDPEEAYRRLQKHLSKEGHISDWTRNRYFEKPFMKRRRLAYENCKQIYNDEMRRKVLFVLKGKHRNPWREE
ncbi:small ribosomal subunit protein bS21m-like [Styela clava]